jgi:hypothetical protein
MHTRDHELVQVVAHPSICTHTHTHHITSHTFLHTQFTCGYWGGLKRGLKGNVLHSLCWVAQITLRMQLTVQLFVELCSYWLFGKGEQSLKHTQKQCLLYTNTDRHCIFLIAVVAVLASYGVHYSCF